jgi:hypothetical protein
VRDDHLPHAHRVRRPRGRGLHLQELEGRPALVDARRARAADRQREHVREARAAVRVHVRGSEERRGADGAAARRGGRRGGLLGGRAAARGGCHVVVRERAEKRRSEAVRVERRRAAEAEVQRLEHVRGQARDELRDELARAGHGGRARARGGLKGG